MNVARHILDEPLSDVPSEAFAQCWNWAAQHLQNKILAYTGGDERKGGWRKSALMAPFIEHLSFRIGNQLYFVLVEDVFDRVKGPGNREGLLKIAQICNGHACIMPMRHRPSLGLARREESWAAVRSGWGLVGARSALEVDPSALATDEQIEMSDWEVHDLAVQVIRQDLTERGRRLISWQSDPTLDPSDWFMGDQGPEWVVVRAARRATTASSEAPANWAAIVRRLKSLSPHGHFAWVQLAARPEDLEAAADASLAPLYRGQVAHVRYDGIS